MGVYDRLCSSEINNYINQTTQSSYSTHLYTLIPLTKEEEKHIKHYLPGTIYQDENRARSRHSKD